VFDATFKIGSFVNSVINFLIIAFVVFLIVKFVNKLMPKKEEEEVIPDNTELYLKEIRDALVNKSDSSTFNNEEPNK
jgi:large conductance mechanosensitive channel